MNTDKAIKYAAVGLAVILTVLCAVLWNEHKNTQARVAVAEAHGKAQDAVIAGNERVNKDLSKQIADRDTKAAEREREFDRERANIKDLKSAVKAITAAVPGAAMVEVHKGDLPPQIASVLPDAPSYAVMPEQTAVDLGQALVDLKKAKARILTLEANNADLSAQLANERTSLKAALSKADEWERAAKGGSAAHRTLTAGKWAAGGALVYLVVQKAMHK